MNRPPNISDIARDTGVSAATVSLALRDKGRMAEATRERIKQVAVDVGYVPNASARSLVGGRTQLISISMPGIGSHPEVVGSVEYYFRLLGAAAARALELDYGLLMTSPSDQPDRVAVDGAVIIDPSENDPTISAFDRLGRPVVTVGRRLGPIGPGAGPELLVDNDYFEATRKMLNHLFERGCRSITLLATEPIDSFQRDSVDSYIEWCGEHDMESRVVMSDSPHPADADAAADTVITAARQPDGVYATIDTLADALLRRAAADGLEVPGDIRVSTLSDSLISRSTTPRLTTIDEKPVDLAEAAVSMLIAAILDPEPASARVMIETELLVRESTT